MFRSIVCRIKKLLIILNLEKNHSPYTKHKDNKKLQKKDNGRLCTIFRVNCLYQCSFDYRVLISVVMYYKKVIIILYFMMYLKYFTFEINSFVL